MPAVKAARPLDIFTKEEWSALTALSRWRGAWLVGHGWLVALAACVLTGLAWQWHWLAGLAVTPFALAIVGGRQLGLAILMHEAAHGLLSSNRKLNNFLGQWLCAASVGSDLVSYRAYHLTHHRFTQQPEDPDLPLSAPFPTTRASLRRKTIRDLTGQTFLKQRAYQFGLAFRGLRTILHGSAGKHVRPRDHSAGMNFNRTGMDYIEPASPEAPDAARETAIAVGRFLLLQAVLLALSLATLGIVPFLIWLAALATTFQLFLRIRNIAEHACTMTGGDDPFSHARTTHAGPIARATVAPYWVNFHSEHHLFMGVPCYRLREAHRQLVAKGHGERMTIAPGYTEVLRLVSEAQSTPNASPA